MDPMDTTHVEDRVLAILGSLNDEGEPAKSCRTPAPLAGYTCRTYLTQRSPPRPREAHRADPRTGTARRSSSPSSPADPHFVEPSSHVIEQYLDDSGQPNFVLPVNQRCEESDYVVRQAKDGFTACLNRDVHRSDRLPAMAALNTFLGWDEIQGCSLHPRLYPIPPAISPAHRRDGCTRHVHTYGWSEISIIRWWPGTAQACTLAPPEVGRRWHWTMGAPATSCRTFTSGKTLPPGRSDRTLPTYSRRARGSKRPTSLRSCLRLAYGP